MVTSNGGGGGGGSEERSSDGGGGGSDGEMKTTAVLKKGPWTAGEDAALREYVEKHGEGNWNAVQRNTGLARCGKSCRLRWANHLRPNLKKGAFSPEEERLILELHSKLGNKWARMAAQLPGRTDNEIKNYWNTRVKRRSRQGLPLYPQDIQGRTTTSPYHHHHHHHHHQLQNNNNNITQTQNLLPTSPSSNSPMLSPHHQPHSPMLSPHHHHQSNSPMLSPHHHHQSNSPMLSPHHQSNSPMLSPHNSSPLPLFDATTANSHTSSTHFFTPLTPPPLTLPSNRYKRYRSPNVEFSLNPPQQPSSPLGQYVPPPLTHPVFSQLSRMPSFSFSSPSFDINSSHLYQTQYKSDDTTGGLVFSAKPELPSSQLYQITMECDATDNNNNDNNNDDMKRDMNAVAARHGSGLLDDLLRESQTISFGGDSRRRGGSMGSDQEKVVFDGFLSHWDDSGSIPSSSEMRSREEPAEQINFMHEDLSSILNIMPPTMKLPLWFSTSEEISNGQSTGGADTLGIDVQQLTSSLPITTSNWDNMPGIC